jgi:hypothetical protein
MTVDMTVASRPLTFGHVTKYNLDPNPNDIGPQEVPRGSDLSDLNVGTTRSRVWICIACARCTSILRIRESGASVAGPKS